MAERRVGAILVTNSGRLEGIFTERDLAIRVVAKGRDPSTTKLGDVMTKNPDVLAPDDPRFPPALRQIPDAPTLLFAAGNLDLLCRTAVAIVGSRSHTRYGGEACRHFAGGLARAGVVVVSGMARGIDALAHGAALDVGGGTVGVLGNGLGVVYPAANRALYERVLREGCLLTEHAPGERPNAGSFPRRNRMISGLARATIVVEARERSGALITADCALGQGHDVLAGRGADAEVCASVRREIDRIDRIVRGMLAEGAHPPPESEIPRVLATASVHFYRARDSSVRFARRRRYERKSGSAKSYRPRDGR